MKVSKKSWHYKLIYDYSPFWPIRSLCGYFWQVVGWAAVWIVGTPIIVTSVVLGPLLVLYPDPVKEWIASQPVVIETLLMIAGIIGIIGWGFGLVVLIALLIGAIGAFVVAPVFDKVVTKYEEPGLFKQWIKAKHDKICPIIEFEND